MISLSAAISVVIYLIVVGMIFGLLWWLVNYIAIPEPFNRFLKAVLAILAVLVIIGILLSLIADKPIFKP